MAAGLGFKEFTTGDVLTASDANGYLASQVVMVFDDATARTAAITSPQEGMISFLKDTNETQYYSGTSWVTIGGSGSVFVGCSVTRTAAQSIANTTYTAIAFTTEDYDTDAIHDNSTNNTRLTVPSGKGGKWQITGPVTFANGTGYRIVRIYKNGVGLISLSSAPTVSGDNTTGVVSNVFNLSAGDYLEVFVYQNSGGALNVQFADTSVQFTYLGA
jgi:hypothetical protein